MNNIMHYKGYTGIVEYSDNEKVLFGKIFGINDVVTFEADSVARLGKAFREAVDDYLETCREIGKEPERVYKGSFNVRIKPELHRRAAVKAEALRMSLNELVELAIVREVDQPAIAPARPKGRRTPRAAQMKVEQRRRRKD